MHQVLFQTRQNCYTECNILGKLSSVQEHQLYNHQSSQKCEKIVIYF